MNKSVAELSWGILFQEISDLFTLLTLSNIQVSLKKKKEVSDLCIILRLTT